MRIIPAIDIINGKCVRLERGDYSTAKIYHSDPVEMAKKFEDNGIQYLHLVDLDGAKLGKIQNQKVLENISSHTCLKVDFGGGLKSNSDLSSVFNAGATQVTVGSIAAVRQDLFLNFLAIYGRDKIILGADSINKKIAIDAWDRSSGHDLIDYIKNYKQLGVEYVVCTDIAKDGMLQGSSHELYKEILSSTNIRLIASGGVKDLNDLLALREIGCEGAIIGKAIYEGRIKLKDLKNLC